MCLMCLKIISQHSAWILMVLIKNKRILCFNRSKLCCNWILDCIANVLILGRNLHKVWISFPLLDFPRLLQTARLNPLSPNETRNRLARSFSPGLRPFLSVQLILLELFFGTLIKTGDTYFITNRGLINTRNASACLPFYKNINR